MVNSKKTTYGFCVTYSTHVVVATEFVEILTFLFRELRVLHIMNVCIIILRFLSFSTSLKTLY